MRKLIGSVAVVVSMCGAGVVLAPGAGAAVPSGECPNTAGLFIVNPGDERFDHNGDGVICATPATGHGNSRSVSGFLLTDNTKPIR